MARYYKDANISIVLDVENGAEKPCNGHALNFSELEWDEHLRTTRVEHIARWPDGKTTGFAIEIRGD